MGFLITAAQWVGNVLIVAGLYGVGNHNRKAFLFSIAGEGFWIAASYQGHNWALLSICIVFLLMALRGYVKWGQEELGVNMQPGDSLTIHVQDREDR